MSNRLKLRLAERRFQTLERMPEYAVLTPPFSYSTTEYSYAATDSGFAHRKHAGDRSTTDLGGVPYYGYRYYNPGLGRWINRDPIGERGGLNLYIFVNNQTLSIIELLGTKIYMPGEPGYPDDLPPGPGEGSGITCDQDLEGATGWTNRKYGKLRVASCNVTIDDVYRNNPKFSIPIPPSNPFPLPNLNFYTITGKMKGDRIRFRRVTESFVECNCIDGVWKWRNSENQSGYSSREMNEITDKEDFEEKMYEIVGTIDLGGIGELPPEDYQYEQIEVSWEKMASMANKTCPDFNIWKYY